MKMPGLSRRKPDGWLVRISVRFSESDVERLGSELYAVRDVLAQRMASAARLADGKEINTRDEYLLVIRPGRRESDSTDPIPVVRDLLERMAQPAQSSIGLIFPRLNAAFTRHPCTASDRAARDALTDGLSKAEATGSGVAVELDLAEQTTRLLPMDTPETEVVGALKRAVDSNQVIMHYQPVVGLADGRITAFEALMRIVDENGGGLLSPARFIAIAEQSGLIHELGRAALRSAAGQMAAWRAEFGARAPSRIAVNVAASQLANADFSKEAATIFSEVGLDALTLELTETERIQEMPQARSALEILRGGGAWVALDDFGVDYSNLAYLRDLEVDIVKIDRSFLDGGVKAERARTILSMVVELAHTLNARVVAEGVSTAEQVMSLAALGVDYGQGEQFGLGVNADEASRLIARSTC